MRAESAADADLEFWLSRWAAWMRWNFDLEGDYPSVASGCEHALTNYCVNEDDKFFIYTALDRRIIAAVDACIDSLDPEHKVAIWWKVGLRKKPAPIPDNVAQLYSEAFVRLRILVLRRVAIAA